MWGQIRSPGHVISDFEDEGGFMSQGVWAAARNCKGQEWILQNPAEAMRLCPHILDLRTIKQCISIVLSH